MDKIADQKYSVKQSCVS